VLLVIATWLGGSAIQAFIPECGTVWQIGDTDITDLVAPGICDSTWVYLATLVVAFVAVAAEIVLGSRGATGRPCPACNTQVPTGQTRCEACGYDFPTAARSNPYH
jgi:hypothetical protein